MRPSYHLLGGVIVTSFIFIFSDNFSPLFGLIFIIWSVLIDLDHGIMVMLEEKKLYLNPFRLFKKIKNRSQLILDNFGQDFNLLHFLEIWIIGMLIGLNYETDLVLILSLASIVHILMDFIDNILYKRRDSRYTIRILTFLQLIYYKKLKS